MFAMNSDSGLLHPVPLEPVMVMKHPYGGFSEMKLSPDVKPQRQTVMIGNNKMALESPSPKPPPVRGDNETIRNRLRESLVSALEMVVGRQVVKSDFGVGKESAEEEREGKSRPFGQMKLEGEGEALPDEENQIASLTSVNEGAGNAVRVEDVKGGVLVAAASIALPNDNAKADSESPSEKAKSCKEDGIQVAEETKCASQLMNQVMKMAWDIEANLFLAMGGVNKKYKEKARSLLFNLKDKSNPELCARVLSGEIAPQILVRMSGEQLASKELSQWRTAKAEAFASMVVLTDADVDPRRIVKKTHKGEFQVMTESEPRVDATESPTSSFPAIVKKGSEEGREEDQSPGIGSKLSDVTKSRSSSPPSSVAQKQLERSMEGEDSGDGAKLDLPTIMSLDDYIDTREDTSPQKFELQSRTQDGKNESKSNGVKESTLTRTPTGSPTSLQTTKSSSMKNAEVHSNGVSVSKQRKRESSSLLWEGSLQLSASRFAPVDGILISGERMEFKDWPKIVEIKGRVRLSVLDKFLRDLQLSRSRRVTVLSLCPSDREGADFKQARAYLKEIADQYRMGDRAGFVEPAPGFELYLVAPGCSSLEVLSDLPVANRSTLTLAKDDEVLVGVVVWRRNHSQGVPSAKGPEHLNGRLKKGVWSGQVSECPSKTNTTSTHWTHSSVGAVPPSLKTVSADVNVSGNSSMHSIQSRDDTSVTRDLSLRTEWPPANGYRVAGAHASRVSEDVNGAVSESLVQHSLELDDVPPGFRPRPVPSFPISRPDSKEHIPVFQPPYVGGRRGPVSGSADRVGETVEAPPGFGPPPASGFRTVSPNDDDDDLPEFSYETEGVMAPETTGFVLSKQSQLVASQISSPVGFQAPVNFADVRSSFSGVRFTAHVNSLPSPWEFQPVHHGLHPPTQPVTVQESFVPRLPLLPNPVLDGWKSSDDRTIKVVDPFLTHKHQWPLQPLNPDPGVSLVVRREEMVLREGDFRQLGLNAEGELGISKELGAGTAGSVGVTPSRTLYGAGVRETFIAATRNYLPEWCSPPVSSIQPGQLVSLPAISGYELPRNIPQQPPSCELPTNIPQQPPSYELPRNIPQQPPSYELPTNIPQQPPSYELPTNIPQQRPQVQMGVQHSLVRSKNIPNWVRAPAPQQEGIRYDYSNRQAQVANTSASKWQSNPFESGNGRSSYPPRKVEDREKPFVMELSVKETDRCGGRDRSRVRERSRERSLTPIPERNRDRDSGRRSRSRSSTPLKHPSPQRKDKRGANGVEQRETKVPRRERKRERDQ